MASNRKNYLVIYYERHNMIDCFNDPYQQKCNAHFKRKDFEKLKKTNSFNLWRTRQLRLQNNECAYCHIDLRKKGIVTHIDHVTPLYHDGKNEYSNFVLSCRRCNIRKWTADNVIYPQWIKDNDIKERTEQRLKSFRQRQQRQAQDILDDDIYDSLSWII
jgi:5-methylcytosine-specific restriction endonuclease McrA